MANQIKPYQEPTPLVLTASAAGLEKQGQELGLLGLPQDVWTKIFLILNNAGKHLVEGAKFMKSLGNASAYLYDMTHQPTITNLFRNAFTLRVTPPRWVDDPVDPTLTNLVDYTGKILYAKPKRIFFM